MDINGDNKKGTDSNNKKRGDKKQDFIILALSNESSGILWLPDAYSSHIFLMGFFFGVLYCCFPSVDVQYGFGMLIFWFRLLFSSKTFQAYEDRAGLFSCWVRG